MFNKFVVSGVIAYFIFASLKPTLGIYALIFTIILCLARINFSFYKNIDFFTTLCVINSGAFIGYLISKWIDGELFQNNVDKVSFLLVLSCLIILIYLLLMDRLTKSKKSIDPIPPQELLKKRNNDLELLIQYVDMFPSIGLNSNWGTGKTFLINNLKRKLKEEYDYEIIEIDLLTCNLNELQSILIKALEEKLYQNGILSKHSIKLKRNIQDSSVLSKFNDLTNMIFTKSAGNSEVFLEFQKDLQNINKRILIIFEDIDRITNKDVIIEVFGISEKLANDNLKIIYQYDEEILKSLDFDYDYLEKYIPFKMNLTELHFKELVLFELQNIDSEILSINDFDFVTQQEHRVLLNHENENQYSFKFEYFPIRKIKNMIAELLPAIKKGTYEKDPKYKEVIIAFYLIKHLYPNIYKIMDTKDGLIETLTFKVSKENETKTKEYTMTQLVSEIASSNISQLQIKKMLENEGNRISYGILKLFNYEIVNRAGYGYISDSLYFDNLAKASHENEKRDRIIQNLMYQGTSALTNNEYAVSKFKEDVLIKPLSQQKEAYDKFISDMSNLDDKIDNQTTYRRIGESDFPRLFEIFKVTNLDEKAQLKLIDFYFDNIDGEFNIEVLNCLNNCPLNTKEEYFKVLKNVVNLEVKYNFEDNYYFNDFLKKYMQALNRMKIYQAWEYFDDDSKFDESRLQIGILTKIRDDLEEIRLHHESLGVKSTQEDINIVVGFLEKLLEVINSRNEIDYFAQQSLHASLEVSREKQIVFDRYKNLLDSESNHEKTYNDIDNSFANGELSFNEVTLLLKDRSPLNNDRTTEDTIEQATVMNEN
ncbi:P-loop NTPase fold protein [Viridibacillus arvi]|uniref:P-loop NTPase fold protein n=1 Tax=Viridibacillus arvi TaxID=263475 RepID=UPI0034CE9BB4